jgi:hypothetical protein
LSPGSRKTARLAAALQRAARPPLAPDLYIILLPPEAAQALAADLARQDALRAGLEQSAARCGLTFAASPLLRIVPDPAALQASVQVDFSSGHEETGTLELVGKANLAGETGFAEDATPGKGQPLPIPAPGLAFLIVNGVQTFSLDRPLVTIGRDPDSDLALDDPRVSRQHAQLRLVQGRGGLARYVIFDLDSTGGTFVNGQPVAQHALAPGDVISLAGLPLVYGQEGEQLTEPTQEMHLPPPTEGVE